MHQEIDFPDFRAESNELLVELQKNLCCLNWLVWGSVRHEEIIKKSGKLRW